MDGRAINEYGVVKIDATPVVYLTAVRLAGDGQDPGQGQSPVSSCPWPYVANGQVSSHLVGARQAPPLISFLCGIRTVSPYFTGEKEAGMRTLFSCLTGRTPDSAGQPVPGLRDSVRTRARSLRSLYTQM